MPSLDQALGIHQHAMMLRARRAEILADNLANADTPNFHARDVDFRGVLQGAENSVPLDMTHRGHLGADVDPWLGGGLLYRVPAQSSLDQNTVDVAAERARFVENSLRYQASLRFLDGRLSSLKAAFRGE